MKLKAALRYQTVELVQCAAAFCLIIGAIIAVIFPVSTFSQGMFMMMPSMGALPYVLMPVLALSVFPGDARFLLQMGLTRVQGLASTAASLAGVCLFLALVEAICAALFPFWPHMQSLFLMSYGPENGLLLDFLFMFLGCAAASAVGLALAILQMRFGGRRVVLFFGAIVLMAFVVLPSLPWSPAFLPRFPIDAVSMAFGFGEGASLANPFVLFAAVTALGLLVSWTAVRRLEVR